MLTAAPDYDFDPSRGVAVRLCNTRLAINPVLAGIKHLSRLENVLARNEWHDSTIVEGLMMDTAGHLVEGTMSNIFVLSGGRLITPALTRCGVEGIIRQIIIEQLAPALSIPLVIRDMDISDVIKADSVFICNSLIGICPVRNIGCHHKRIDKTLLALITALEKLQGV
jgi:4-amino-4-deoxychorismate lyase